MSQPPEPEDAVARALAAGTDVVGAVAGAAAGLLVAGPPGALGGAAAGPAMAAGLKEVLRRSLSRREQARVGGAFHAAAEALRERQDAGDRIRGDNFFRHDDGRSDADEMFEGVLLAAQRSYEERKVPYIGYLMAKLCFEKQVDGYLANWAINTAHDLTWAQFVLLSAVGRADTPLPAVVIQDLPQSWVAWGVHEQLADLGYARRGMIYAPLGETEHLGLSFPNVALPDQKLSRAGLLLYQLLWLDRVPKVSVLHVLTQLTDEGERGEPQN